MESTGAKPKGTDCADVGRAEASFIADSSCQPDGAGSSTAKLDGPTASTAGASHRVSTLDTAEVRLSMCTARGSLYWLAPFARANAQRLASAAATPPPAVNEPIKCLPAI